MNDNFETLQKTPITEEQFNNVCNLIANNVSLNKACAQLHIAKQSVYIYMDKIGDSAKNQYVRAKESQIEAMIDEMQDVEEECLQAVECIEDPKKANALVQAYRLKLDNLKWIASKLKAKKYGDKVDITNSDGSLIRNMTLTPIPSKSNSDIQLNNIDNSNGQ